MPASPFGRADRPAHAEDDGEAAAEAERRAEEAARAIVEPDDELIAAEALFRQAADERRVAEVSDAAVERLDRLAPLSPDDQALLDTIEQMAQGQEVARPIPPAQMVAALVRLLIKQGIIRDADYALELSRK